MYESTIKTILDKYNVSESENLSKALEEILSELPKQREFAQKAIRAQNDEIIRDNRMRGIL